MKQATRCLLFPFLLLWGLWSVASIAQDQEPVFSQAELDQILAPVALYPDTVLSHILVASTYPLEVVEAARWSRANPGLEGEDAVAAVEDQNWDPSVKALVAFPELLTRMDEDLEWTTALGDAVLAQEGQVVDTIQQLRHRAHDEGNLQSTEHVEVIREREVIYVEPRETHIIHVPYYDPRVVYGTWWHPAYPPWYWGPPHGYHTGVSIFWGSGFRISSAFFFGHLNWHRRHVTVVNVHHHHRHHRPVLKSWRHHAGRADHRRWRHNPSHRRGVAYRDARSSREFGRPRASRRGDRRWSRQDASRDSRRWQAGGERRGSARRDGGDRNRFRSPERRGRSAESTVDRGRSGQRSAGPSERRRLENRLRSRESTARDSRRAFGDRPRASLPGDRRGGREAAGRDSRRWQAGGDRRGSGRRDGGEARRGSENRRQPAIGQQPRDSRPGQRSPSRPEAATRGSGRSGLADRSRGSGQQRAIAPQRRDARQQRGSAWSGREGQRLRQQGGQSRRDASGRGGGRDWAGGRASGSRPQRSASSGRSGGSGRSFSGSRSVRGEASRGGGRQMQRRQSSGGGRSPSASSRERGRSFR